MKVIPIVGGIVTKVHVELGVAVIGARQIVFVPAPDEEGRFLARPVQVGLLRGDFVTIRSGVQPGEVVVTEGSFFLRAEMLRNAPAGS